MNRSESIGMLAAALAKAQGVMKPAVKDQANPFFRSKYADLASIIEVIREPFSANGIAFTQLPRSTADGVEVETLFVLQTEKGEEFISETLCVPVSKDDAQGIGSAITYAKRYLLQAMAGVPSEDDDGNAAAASVAGEKHPAKHSDNGSSKTALITKTEWADIQRRLSGDGQASLLRHFKLERGGQLRVDQLADVGLVIDANPSWHYRPEAKRMTPAQQDEMDELAKRLGLDSVEQLKVEIFTVLQLPVEPLALTQQQAEQVLSAMRGKVLEASKV